IAYLDGVIDGLRAQDYSQAAALPAALGSLSEGVAATKGGVDGLVGLLTGQIAYLDAISASNGEVLDRASALAAASPDATTTALVAGLTRQRMMLTALRDGDADLGLPMGLADTRDSLQEVSAGLGEIAAGLRATAEGAAPLAELPVRFGALASALETLRDGGAVAGRTMPGLVTSSAGLAGVASGISAAGDGVGAAGEGLAMLSELPEMLGELRSTLLALEDGGEVAGTYLPGVSTTAEALGEASSGLLGGLNDAEFGKEVVELMEDDVGGYDTFLGKPEGATGDVRFVFKFDAVRKAEE
ncbi:MAG: hypothetical protein IBX62_09435, partial [Coriobacteriia bacterium]|nr:hypothetical protein [Coriobacteriia bacterium]